MKDYVFPDGERYPIGKSDLERFWAKVKECPVRGCWVWTAALTDGYGRFGLRRRQVYAHRFAYMLLVGDIPAELVMDHLCRNRACVNPAHLEPVTHQVNLLRGETVTAHNASKTHCDRGHEFTPDNTRVLADGTRFCRACDRGRYRETDERKRHLDGRPPAVHNAAKTHCVAGHPFDEENTYRRKGGGRNCRACGRITAQARAAKRKTDLRRSDT